MTAKNPAFTTEVFLNSSGEITIYQYPKGFDREAALLDPYAPEIVTIPLEQARAVADGIIWILNDVEANQLRGSA